MSELPFDSAIRFGHSSRWVLAAAVAMDAHELCMAGRAHGEPWWRGAFASERELVQNLEYGQRGRRSSLRPN